MTRIPQLCLKKFHIFASPDDERHNSVAIGLSRNGLNRNELHNWREGLMHNCVFESLTQICLNG